MIYLINGIRANPRGRSTIVFKKTTHKQLAVQPEMVFLVIQTLIALKDQTDDPGTIRQLTEVLAIEKPADIRQDARLEKRRSCLFEAGTRFSGGTCPPARP